MLDYRMETFLTLCEERSYSKTAKRLCITQPAITQHIQYLERYYNAKLFEYMNKQVTLTDEGRILERYAMRMNFTTMQVHNMIAQSQGGPTKLRIGASPIISEIYMPGFLQKLTKIAPNLRIIYNTKNSKELLDGLKNGSFSCVFVEGSFKKEDYAHMLVYQDEVILVSGTPIPDFTVNDLANQTLICTEPGSGLRKTTNGILYDKGLSLENFADHLQVNNVSMMKHLVQANTGIGFMCKSYIKKELEEGTLHELSLGLTAKQEYNFVVLKDCLFFDMYVNLYRYFKDYADTVL